MKNIYNVIIIKGNNVTNTKSFTDKNIAIQYFNDMKSNILNQYILKQISFSMIDNTDNYTITFNDVSNDKTILTIKKLRICEGGII